MPTKVVVIVTFCMPGKWTIVKVCCTSRIPEARKRDLTLIGEEELLKEENFPQVVVVTVRLKCLKKPLTAPGYLAHRGRSLECICFPLWVVHTHFKHSHGYVQNVCTMINKHQCFPICFPATKTPRD